MEYLIILLFLINYFLFGLRAPNSEEIANSKGLHRYCESCSQSVHTYINQNTTDGPKNLIITKNRFNNEYTYSKTDIGLVLMKNEDHFGFGIALVRPLFKLF